MAAYAEGLNILKNADIGKRSHEKDAETTPLRNPEHYQYDFNLADITELWRRGSVVSSWLLDLTAQALASDPGLGKFGGKVSDSGEGRWTVAAAIDEGVPAHVLTASLFERFASRDLDLFQNKVLSAMRFGFGGHVEKAAHEVHRLRTGRARWATHTPTRSCFSGPRAIWRTRRSFPRCRRWPSAGSSTCRSSAWPRPAGPSTSCARGRRTASRSTAAWTVTRSTSCADCCATSTGTTRIRRPSRRSGSALGRRRSTPRTTWRSLPRSSDPSWSNWRNPGARKARASSSRNPSARTSPSARDLNRILLGTFVEARHLPDRPLPRQAPCPQHAVLSLHESDPGGLLESDPRRERADHDGGGLRHPGPRRLLRRDRARSATSSRTTSSRC